MDILTNWVTWITVFTALILLYKYLTRNFGYWEKQGIPVAKVYPFFGTEAPVFMKPMHEIDIERSKTLGKIYGSYFISIRGISVADPEIVKHILVKDFHVFVNRQIVRSGLKLFDAGLLLAVNNDWKRIRSVTSPTFSTGKIRKMTSMIQNSAQKLTNYIITLAEKGEKINVKNEMSKYSAEVIASCAFGLNFDAFKNPNHPFVTHAKKIFEGGAVRFLVFVLIVNLPNFLSRLKNVLSRISGTFFFIKAAKEIIHMRRTTKQQGNVDFLQLMLDSKEEDLDNSESVAKELNKTNGVTEPEKQTAWEKKLDEDEIVAQCATFLFAGHDTVATTIAYVIYNLALHQDVQETLLREIDEAWDKNDGLDYDVINKLTYLNAVVSETLRLQSVAIRLTRQAKEDYPIPNTNIVIPKNGMVNIPVYAIHHDPDYFPDPEKFDPDRFLPENKDKILPFTYMPFGDGPRNCIAMRFALMEVKFSLAYLLHHIRFLPTEETMKPLKFFIGSSLLQSKGITVRPEKRINIS